MMITQNIQQSLSKAELNQLSIIQYFRTFNQGEFAKTAQLFVEEGRLLAPFENPIIGREQIIAYLDQEAKGMELFPERGYILKSDSQNTELKVVGKARTPLFTVNIGWNFELNQRQEILSVTISLLASLQELLNLKKVKQP